MEDKPKKTKQVPKPVVTSAPIPVVALPSLIEAVETKKATATDEKRRKRLLGL